MTDEGGDRQARTWRRRLAVHVAVGAALIGAAAGCVEVIAGFAYGVTAGALGEGSSGFWLKGLLVGAACGLVAGLVDNALARWTRK